jgi:hypothetical protein
LLTIAWHQAINRRRSLTRLWRRVVEPKGDPADAGHASMMAGIAAAGPTPEQAALQQQLRTAIRDAIRPLTPKLRDALLLAQSGDYTYDEVGAMSPPPPPGGDARPRAAKTGQPINIKVEFTITDQRTGTPPVKRTVSVVVADSYTGVIRSQSDIAGFNSSVPLNVDTSPNLLADGRIRLGFNLQYDSPLPVQSSEGGTPRGTVLKTAMHDSVMLILENGKSVIAAQSADPIGDRQVTVEVKATILK